MQKIIVSFYHCPVSMSVIEKDFGEIEYTEIKTEKQREVKSHSNFINYFNLYFRIGEEIDKEVAARYLDKETGKIYAFITEDNKLNKTTAALTSKERYQQLNKYYKERNIKKILA